MKRSLALAFLITVLGASVVFAGVTNISGQWSGTFVAIYADGTIVELANGSATIIQNESYPNLFYGFMTFEFGGESFTRLLTGYIGTDKRISINLTEEDNGSFIPVGIIEGHLRGKTINGVVRDFTDTTTTMVIATKD